MAGKERQPQQYGRFPFQPSQPFCLPYHSPHKFRHGNAVYSLKMAKDIQALKAVSQNLMHSNISITDGVYGILSDNDVRGQIAALGRITNSSDAATDFEELIVMTKRLLDKLGDKVS
jgi:hypothetical protein